jgi:peptidoglycan/xylan/chitin deacetylase (PgdA/CDA1 family)
MAKAIAIKVLAAILVFAALWLGDAPTSWWIAGVIVLLALALIAWGVFDVNSPLWTPTLWQVPGVEAVALTFDDGPDPVYTPRVLEILARENVAATFFVVGERARANPDLLREIDRQGHLIGNHSFSHAWNINFGLHARLAHEIDNCNEAIVAAIGKRPRFYRAPHGFKNPALGDVLAKRAMTCVGWQVRGFDAVRADASEIARRLVQKAKAGGILLLHDGSGLQGTRDRSATLEALPLVITGLRARGLAFKRLDELTALPDATAGATTRHVATLRVPAHHPALTGHFPGNPIVPGVVILDAVICAAEAWLDTRFELAGLSHAKFLAPLKPDEAARIELQLHEPQLDFVVYRGQDTIAKGTLRSARESAS